MLHALEKKEYAEIIEDEAAVYLAAVLEYISAELLEVSGNVARDRKRSRIIPYDISAAVR